MKSELRKGIFLVLGAFFLRTLGSLALKLVRIELPTLEVAFFRFLFGALILLGVKLIFNSRKESLSMRLSSLLPTSHLRLHLARCFLGIISYAGMVYSIFYLPLADWTALSYFNPLLLTIFAWLLLRERVPFLRWLAVGLGLLGVLVVSKPGSEVFSVAALPLFLACGCAASSDIFVKLLRTRNEPPATIVFFFFSVASLTLLLALPFVWETPTVLSLAGLIVVGGTGMAFQVIYSQAFGLLGASMIAPFSYTSLLWAVLLDYLVFSTTPDLLGVVGAALVMSDAFLAFWSIRREKASGRN